MFSNAATYLALTALAITASQTGHVQGDDKLKDLIKSNGYVEIKIVDAHVPDLDPLPMQKDSDVFVRVYLNDTKEMICETQTVQDENKPKVSFLRLLALFSNRNTCLYRQLYLTKAAALFGGLLCRLPVNISLSGSQFQNA